LLSGPEQVLAQFFNAVANLLQREFSRSEVFVDLLKSTIALFVVLNPIGTVPLFIGITQNMKKEERKAVSKTAIITSGIVLVVFVFAQ
jgi:small neutral amino acid transporter SnatA (MarC family)